MKQVRKRGFTLIELLIVIAVISIIVGITLPRFKGVQDEGNIIKAKADLRTLQTAVESFYIHNDNAYPAALADLTSATPLIVSVLPTDPYNAGNNYGYSVGSGVNNQNYVLSSRGPDQNGAAVISNAGTVTETNGDSCIYVSNIAEDTTP